MRHSMSKDTAFNAETTPRHTFLCSDSQCLPPGDPIIQCAKHGSPITGKSFIWPPSTSATTWSIPRIPTSLVPLPLIYQIFLATLEGLRASEYDWGGFFANPPAAPAVVRVSDQVFAVFGFPTASNPLGFSHVKRGGRNKSGYCCMVKGCRSFSSKAKGVNSQSLLSPSSSVIRLFNWNSFLL